MFALLFQMKAAPKPTVPWDGEISYAAAEAEPMSANV